MVRVALANLATVRAGVYATKVARILRARPVPPRHQGGEPIAALTARSSTRSSNGLHR